MIPKKIHLVWLGDAARSDLNVRCVDSWRRVMPDYEIKEWGDGDMDLDTPYCRAAYEAGRWSRISNVVRLRALQAEGGVYLDTDVEAMKSFDPLLRHGCFVGFQQGRREADWVNTAVIGAEADHPFLARCLEITENVFAETGRFARAPWVATRALSELGLRDYGLQDAGGVAVYPTEYFYPYPWYGTFSPECVTDETFAVHHWEGTWTPRGPRKAALRVLKRGLAALDSRLGTGRGRARGGSHRM